MRDGDDDDGTRVEKVMQFGQEMVRCHVYFKVEPMRFPKKLKAESKRKRVVKEYIKDFALNYGSMGFP